MNDFTKEELISIYRMLLHTDIRCSNVNDILNKIRLMIDNYDFNKAHEFIIEKHSQTIKNLGDK